MVLWEGLQGDVLELVLDEFMVPCDKAPLWARKSMVSGAGCVATPIAGGWEIGRVDTIVQVKGIPLLLGQQLGTPNGAGGHGQECAI